MRKHPKLPRRDPLPVGTTAAGVSPVGSRYDWMSLPPCDYLKVPLGCPFSTTSTAAGSISWPLA